MLAVEAQEPSVEEHAPATKTTLQERQSTFTACDQLCGPSLALFNLATNASLPAYLSSSPRSARTHARTSHRHLTARRGTSSRSQRPSAPSKPSSSLMRVQPMLRRLTRSIFFAPSSAPPPRSGRLAVRTSLWVMECLGFADLLMCLQSATLIMCRWTPPTSRRLPGLVRVLADPSHCQASPTARASGDASDGTTTRRMYMATLRIRLQFEGILMMDCGMK